MLKLSPALSPNVECLATNFPIILGVVVPPAACSSLAEPVKREVTVISKDMFQKVRALHRQQVSNRQIAKQLGIDRKTVAEYLKMNAPPKYTPREGHLGTHGCRCPGGGIAELRATRVGS